MAGELAGKCYCGAVQYRVADEFLYAANCHCSNCRAGTGSAFKPFAGIERSKLEVVEGADRLLVWGEEDPFLPVEVADRLNELLGGSTLALLPGCSHFVTEEAPETLVPLVAEYLRARYLGETHGHEHAQPLIQLRRP